ncbi:hypothetical protein [Clostridium sp.]
MKIQSKLVNFIIGAFDSSGILGLIFVLALPFLFIITLENKFKKLK